MYWPLKFDDKNHTQLDELLLVDKRREPTASPTVKNRPSGLVNSFASSDLWSFSITSPNGFTNTSCVQEEAKVTQK